MPGGYRPSGTNHLPAGGANQLASEVTLTQPPQRKVMYAEVVDARLKAGQIAADQVQVDVVEGPGAGGSPEEDLPAVVHLPLRDPCGEVLEAGQRRQLGYALAVRCRVYRIDRLQRRNLGRREIPWQSDRF